MTALQIEGAILTIIPEGVSFKYGWMPATDISKADALKIRDWLNENFPPLGKVTWEISEAKGDEE